MHKEELLEIYYLGNKIEIVQNINSNIKVQKADIRDNKLFLDLVSPLDTNMKEHIRELLYKQHAPTLFLDRVEYFSKIMELKPKKVSFRKAKTRWGSCSYVNNISLNIALTAIPKSLSDYIIVHELAHIKHKNHSKEFWKFVELFYPSYKQAKEELKMYSYIL